MTLEQKAEIEPLYQQMLVVTDVKRLKLPARMKAYWPVNYPTADCCVYKDAFVVFADPPTLQEVLAEKRNLIASTAGGATSSHTQGYLAALTWVRQWLEENT